MVLGSEGRGYSKCLVIFYGCHKWRPLMFPARNQWALSSTFIINMIQLFARFCTIVNWNILVTNKVVDGFPQNSVK